MFFSPPRLLGCQLPVTISGVIDDLDIVSSLLKESVVTQFQHRAELRLAWCHYSNVLALLQASRAPRRAHIKRAINTLLENIERLVSGPP